MKVIKMHIAYDTEFANVATVYVMAEGAVRDVAVYKAEWNNNKLAECSVTRVMHDTARDGVKLSEREAHMILSVPHDKHYRR